MEWMSTHQDAATERGMSDEERLRKQFMSPFIAHKDVRYVQSQVDVTGMRFKQALPLPIQHIVSEHQIHPEYGDEQADAGRDCRTRLARSNSQARTGTGKYSLSLFG